MTVHELKKYFGGKLEIAKALNMSYARVANWFYNEKIPLGVQYQIEVITKGKLKATQ